MFKKVLGILLATVLFVSTGYALEVAKVNVPDSFSPGGNDLVLNGAGVRSKWMLDLYVGSLFLPQKSTDAQAIMSADEPMAIRLNIISGLITSEKMISATQEGFENSTGGNLDPIADEVETFIAVFNEPIKEGDVFDLVYVPAKGVETFKNGKPLAVVGDLEFKKALFGIWLCDKPAQKSLKQEMLGM